MITPVEVYLVLQASRIEMAFSILTFFTGIALSFFFIGYMVYKTDEDGETIAKRNTMIFLKKMVLRLSILLIFFSIGATFTPSTPTLAGAILIPDIINSNMAQRIPKVLDLELQKLETQLETDVHHSDSN